MRMKRKAAVIATTIVIIVFILMQPISPIHMDKTNPPVRSDIPAPHTVKPIMRKACYDCHSHETTWPWYSHVAPVSWLLESDVQEGRRELNFSEWSAYPSHTRDAKLKEIYEELQEEAMPPWYYSLMHPGARLAPGERNVMMNWIQKGVSK